MAPSCASKKLHNPRRSGANLSQTMLRHLTVGSTIGSGDTTLSNATMQPDKQAHREAVRTASALHNSPFAILWTMYATLQFSNNGFRHIAKPARSRVRDHTPQVPSLSFAVSRVTTLLPATLKNALLELLVTATKTYTKEQSLEFKKKERKQLVRPRNHRFPSLLHFQALQSARCPLQCAKSGLKPQPPNIPL